MLGPADGRYVLRDPGEDDASHVLVLRTLGAAERRRPLAGAAAAPPSPSLPQPRCPHPERR